MFVRENKTKSTKYSIAAHPIVLLAVIIITCIFCYSLIKNIFSLRNKQKLVQEKKDQIEQLKKDNSQLEEEIKNRQSDFFQEQVIRDELNMKKEGETVIQLPSDI